MPTSNEPTSEPASGRVSVYAIYVLILMLLINTISYADRHLFSILIPAIKQEFGASDSLMGLIGGPGFMISYVLFTIPLARLADRWSRRKVLALSATFWSVATALCGMAVNVAQLAAARVAVGIGEAGGFPPSQSIISSLFDGKRRATALGILSASTSLGIVLGLTGGGMLAASFGWREAFLILAAPGLPLALMAWLTGPKRVKPLAGAQSAAATSSTLATMKNLWSIRSLRQLAVAMGVFNIFGYAGAIWLPTYFMRSHGMTAMEAGVWLGLGVALGGVGGAMSSGFIVDAMNRRNISWQLWVPAVGFFLATPLMATMLLVPNGASLTLAGTVIPIVALLSIVTSFLTALWAGPSYAAAANLVRPDQRAQATAMLVVSINVLGSTVGPLLAGIVSDILTPGFGDEGLRYSLLVMGILIPTGGILFWRAGASYAADMVRANSEMKGANPEGPGQPAS